MQIACKLSKDMGQSLCEPSVPWSLTHTRQCCTSYLAPRSVAWIQLWDNIIKITCFVLSPCFVLFLNMLGHWTKESTGTELGTSQWYHMKLFRSKTTFDKQAGLNIMPWCPFVLQIFYNCNWIYILSIALWTFWYDQSVGGKSEYKIVMFNMFNAGILYRQLKLIV